MWDAANSNYAEYYNRPTSYFEIMEVHAALIQFEVWKAQLVNYYKLPADIYSWEIEYESLLVPEIKPQPRCRYDEIYEPEPKVFSPREIKPKNWQQFRMQNQIRQQPRWKAGRYKSKT